MKTEKEFTKYSNIQKSDGSKLTIRKDIAVIKDLVETCSYCGRVCLGSYYLWFVEDDKRKTIMVNSHRFDSFLESCYKMENERILNYKSLPQFITEYNECKAWAAFESIDGEVLNKKRFKEALQYIETFNPKDTDILELLIEFLNYCFKNNHQIKISKE